MRQLLLLLIGFPFSVFCQQTFQQFRFDLDPNMPPEEPNVLDQIAHPHRARQEVKKQNKKIEMQLKRNASPHTQPVSIISQSTSMLIPQQPGVLPQQQNFNHNQIPRNIPSNQFSGQPIPTAPIQQQFFPNPPQQQQFLPQANNANQNTFVNPAFNPRPMGFGSQLAGNQPSFQQNQQPPPYPNQQQYFANTARTPIAANQLKTPIPFLPELIPRQPVVFNPAPADLASPDVVQMIPNGPLAKAARNVMPMENKGPGVVTEAPDVTDEIVEVSSVSEPPPSSSMWFKEDFDTTNCRNQLKQISQLFKGKFPSSIASRTKDAKLADLVETRLIECDKKAQAGHWEKVNSLLGRINSLSKSEEADCRSGLIQEQISCQNLFNSACQFVQPSFQFRLVPARIVIQEARHAENGSEKCRNVVRTVKQRLGQ